MTTYQQEFADYYNLSEDQQHKFQQYAQLLQAYNQRFNLTAITDLQAIYTDHFSDSLALTKQRDLKNELGIIDVGSGGGFPALPLAIVYPELPVYCVEVTQKKQEFLRLVAETLQLPHVIVCGQDWRTFLRTVTVSASCITARASLQVSELLRALKPASYYKHCQLVYWASQKWEPAVKEKRYIYDEFWYKNAHKKRRLVIMKSEG